MFPGHWFSTPFFVQYGQDYTGAMDEYVYAVSNNGSWNNGNYLVLGRVPRSKIATLDAQDWEFFAGLDVEEHPQWVSDYLRSPAMFLHRHYTSMAGIQYVPAFERFILMEWAYTDLDDPEWPFSQSMLCLYEAPHPWGPWRHCHTEPNWNRSSYNPGMPAKWFEEDGRRLWLTSSADCANRHPVHNKPKELEGEFYHFTTQQLALRGK